jgi:uncharacterized protein (TIGR00730 family)
VTEVESQYDTGNAQGTAEAEEERGAVDPLEPRSKRPGGPVARRIASTGNAVLDRQVANLIRNLEGPNLDLIQETLVAGVRLAVQGATRAELKLVSASLKELAYSFRVFAPYRHLRKVTIFGSARTQRGEPAYVAARDFAREIAAEGWMVITGAGPGIMAAGHEGAGAKQSFGANIRLPGLNPANVYIANDDKLINFKYFFTRKVTFIKESAAFLLLPGGLGTLDETFELLTLIQTGKSGLHPVVMLEPSGSTYWQAWQNFITEQVLANGLIAKTDLALFKIASTPEEAVEEICRFYANYQSARFVGDRLVLRLKKAPDLEALAHLNAEFADLLQHGVFEVIQPTSAELRDNDEVGYERLAFYPVHAYGRIRQLIDALNAL